ncbi:MAG: TRAP transporter substrate-binding protein DctP [Acidaminococcaceae bacterium]|jgi:tripartite ATP-independent transporter DctP family solute receptor|nr:TRAP transporter substrate-binding protein DctP [Acidaminococcaceae bacterium]
MKKMVKICTAIVMLLSLIVVSGCGKKDAAKPAAGKAGGKYNIKFGSTGNAEHQYTIYGEFFKKKVEELTKGNVKVTIYPNNALGNEREMAEGTIMGTLEMCCVTSDGTLPSWVPETQILSIPYLFSSKKEAYAVLDTTLQKYLEPKFEAKGLMHLGFAELGFRHFTNNKKPIQKASDMEGLKIRVQEAPIWFALMKSLKATATPVPFSELYTALQQGMVDGQENPTGSIASSKFYEVQKYMCLDGHTYAAGSTIINKKFFESLPDEYKKAVIEAAKYATEMQRKDINGKEEKMLADMKAKGLQVTTVDIDSFKKATENLYKQPEVQKLVSPELVELVKKAIADNAGKK